MSKKRSKKCNPMSDLMNACPPENPYQFFCNAGLMAMGEKYGAVMNDLSEEVANIMLNAASTAIYGALEAANVSNEWIDLVKPTKERSAFTESVINSPVDVFMAMAWKLQVEHFPQLLDDKFSEEYHGKIIDAVDAMLRLALTAAGVAGAWERIYDQTVEQMKAERITQ